MKIVHVVGARPQFVKLSPLSRRISGRFNEIVVHTGQHYDLTMSDLFFKDLDIESPKYNLCIGSGTHGEQTGKMIMAIEKVLLDEKPDLVIVFGDTNSTLSGALAACKLHIPVAHVEAGLRSFNRVMPEEINRVLTDHCSDILFVPTTAAEKNLVREGLSDKTFLTGDIMLDAIMENKSKAKETSGILRELLVVPKEYCLLTLHRPYIVDSHEVLERVLSALSKTRKKIVFPVHPRTRKMIDRFDIELSANIQVIDPLGYLDFICLEESAEMIVTDSGGVQKEAYILSVPCITVRPETEWVETTYGGWNTLVGSAPEKLIEAIENPGQLEEYVNVFGEYGCAIRMVKIIEAFLKDGRRSSHL